MKSKMKLKATAISIATVLTFAMISLFGITPSGSASTATLNFPAGANQNVSKTFQAPKGHPVNVIFNLKNNGAPGVNSAKRLTTKLYTPDGLLSDAKEESVNPGQTRAISLGGKFTGASSCGNWKVEVTNPNDPASNVTATITINFLFVPLPIIHTESVFAVVQGQMEPRPITIPQSGDLTITADWAPANVPLRFTLKKGDSNVTAVSDSGYGGTHPNQLKLKYRVTQQDIQTYGTRWNLEVKESGIAYVRDIKPTKVLMPGCF